MYSWKLEILSRLIGKGTQIMGRRRAMRLRELVGAIKDKATQSKAAIFSKPGPLVSLLRATTHDPHAPPDPKHLAAMLRRGNCSSRATASAAVAALMDRLHRTGDACVALKCLIAAHHVAVSGAFILRDQLAVLPSAGGRNYLNLAGFRDGSNHMTWDLSTWVRWYGGYVESLLSISRVLGFFLGCESEISDRDFGPSVSAAANAELVRETQALVGLVEQICKQPEALIAGGRNILVDEIRRLVGEDCVSAINEISVRAAEFRERVSCLSFVESVELVCALKRLEDCKENILLSSSKDLVEFWGLVGEVKERAGKGRDETVMVVKLRKEEMRTESARFRERVLRPSDSVRFGSARLAVGA